MICITKKIDYLDFLLGSYIGLYSITPTLTQKTTHSLMSYMYSSSNGKQGKGLQHQIANELYQRVKSPSGYEKKPTINYSSYSPYQSNSGYNSVDPNLLSAFKENGYSVQNQPACTKH
jgi:hypothetical protein